GSVAEKFQQAKALGFDGVEVWSLGLSERMEEVAEASITSGVPIAAVFYQRLNQILHPNPDVREQGLADLRETICCAADLGAAGVIFIPHHGARMQYDELLPDLSPWMTQHELYTELLYTHLRTLEDYSMALGVKLLIEPSIRFRAPLIRRVEQAAKLIRRLNHPNVRVAADTFTMALEEDSLVETFRAYGAEIGYLYVSDSNDRLPGLGLIDFAAVGEVLKSIGYAGWVTLSSDPANGAETFSASDLTQSLAYLRQRGW
ncbi:MAG: sugar phosphate isomerase/epimerase, partial [Anaerolineae bacterium]|nr:sugar phosphate isomerase/epimerase [Anaerolineae bacterium]